MLAEAWKGTQLAFLRCLFKLIRWDANHQGHRQNKASRQIAFLHYISRRIYIFIFKALAPMFNLEIQSQRYRYSIYIHVWQNRDATVCTQEEQMEKNRGGKGGK